MTPSTTLALETVMLSPHFAEIVKKVREVSPTWYLDQLDAAVTDVSAAQASTGERVGLDMADTPTWLRLGVLDAWASYCLGDATTCVHNPSADRPEPVFAAAWKPGIVACRACTHLLVLPRNSRADRICDACGYECAGLDAGDPIYPSSAQIASMLYHFGTCAGCRPSLANGVAA